MQELPARAILSFIGTVVGFYIEHNGFYTVFFRYSEAVNTFPTVNGMGPVIEWLDAKYRAYLDQTIPTTTVL